MAGASPVGRLPARCRVRKKRDFASAKQAGRRVRTPSFVLVLSARPRAFENELPRLGIVASRRVGNAVQRNRAKRLIREAFRTTRELFDPGLDIVVIVTRSLDEKMLSDVITEWRSESARIQRRGREALSDRPSTEAPVEPRA